MWSKVFVVLVLGVVVSIEGKHFEIKLNYYDELINMRWQFLYIKIFLFAKKYVEHSPPLVFFTAPS